MEEEDDDDEEDEEDDEDEWVDGWINDKRMWNLNQSNIEQIKK